MQDATKMLPKVTVSNIPNSLLTSLHEGKSSNSVEEYRFKVKDLLTTKFLEKNEDIEDQVSNHGKLFQIVFVNTGRDTTTVGIKVSPEVRDLLISKERIFIGNTSCKVTDRFDLRQCFHCQQFGHISSKCQDRQRGKEPVCMFCSASHSTRDCPERHDESKHRCVNCSHSDDPSLKQACNTHHSGSNICPLIITEKINIKQRTEYSKNI